MMGYSVWQLIDVYLQTGELTHALDVLDQHLNENPSDFQALGVRGEIHLRLGHWERAIADFGKIPDLTPDQTIHHAVALKRLGSLGAGLAGLTDALLAWDGEKTADYHRLIDCFVDIALADGGAPHLQQALDHLATITEPTAYTLARLGEISQLLADYHPAIAYYSGAIDQALPQVSINAYFAPSVSSWLCARAGCYQGIGDTALAIRDYERAESLMPDDRTIPMQRAHLLNDHDLMRQIWQSSHAKQRALLQPITPESIRQSEG